MRNLCLRRAARSDQQKMRRENEHYLPTVAAVAAISAIASAAATATAAAITSAAATACAVSTATAST